MSGRASPSRDRSAATATSSIPMRTNPSSGSCRACASATTRVTIRPDRAPRDSQQLLHRGTRAVRGEPCALILEPAGVPGPMPSPGDLGHDHPVFGAPHPGGVGPPSRREWRPDPMPATAGGPPPGSSHRQRRPHTPQRRVAPFRARTDATITPNTPPRPRSARHRGAAAIPSRNARRSFLSDPALETAGKGRRGAACTAYQQLRRPTEMSEEPKSGPAPRAFSHPVS